MAKGLPEDRRPVVISGPSGVGKGTLINRLYESRPGVFTATVSHTTRGPRTGEVEGKAYFFVSEDEFSSLVARGGFIESTFYSGNHYGTSKQTIIDQTAQGLVVILDIDEQGVQSLQNDSTISGRYVFIKPPTFEALEQRLRNRSTESEQSVLARLTRAQLELARADSSDLYDAIIVNDDIEIALQELVQFIYKATDTEASSKAHD